MEFTGERVVPGKTPPEIYKEHIDRYVFAVTLSQGKDVLDVACGTGYGVGYLAGKGARTATGVDSSLQTMVFARDWIGDQGRTGLLCADGIRLPFPENTFDMVVSFETLEHIKEYTCFVEECSRVLRDGGMMVCSTPNRRVFSPDIETPINPYHVREFWHGEFLELLSRYFHEVDLYGQCDVTLADNSVERDRGVHEFRDNETVSSGYIIAVAKK